MADPDKCPYCNQPLVNKAARKHLHAAEATLRREILDEVEAAAEEKAEKKLEGERSKRERNLNREIEMLQQQNEDLQRRLEGLNAPQRGAINEEDITADLMDAFPEDKITREGKGGDIVHEVMYRAGQRLERAGMILYECKDTTRWNKTFITQIKSDGKTRRTPYLLIVSTALPAKEKGTCIVDDVVVADPAHARHLARIMRRMVIETHRAGLAGKDHAAKTSRLYEYLRGDEFREELNALVDAGSELNEMLQLERKDHERGWKKRERAYDDLLHNSVAIDESICRIIESPSGSGATKRGRRLARLAG